MRLALKTLVLAMRPLGLLCLSGEVRVRVVWLKATVPLSRHWNATTLVDNLFNQNYEVVTGYPMPGVSAAGGFTLSF
jgi:outer membrane cobalamin receptor